MWVLNENGLIEVLSALGYFICVWQLARKGGNEFVLRHAHLFCLVLLLGCRELDFHRRLFSTGIFRTRFFVSEEISVLEKIAGGAIWLLISYIVIRSVFSHGGFFLGGLRRGSRVTVAILAAMTIGILVKILDGIERTMRALGLQPSGDFLAKMFALEEVMELGIPLMLGVAIFYHFSRIGDVVRRRKRSTTMADEAMTGWQA